MQLAFGKRKYLYGAIVARVTGNEDKESTAKAMDLQRKALHMTLAQYLVHLKNEDGKTKKRRRQESAPTLLIIVGEMKSDKKYESTFILHGI